VPTAESAEVPRKENPAQTALTKEKPIMGQQQPIYKPGEPAPHSGLYEQVSPHGGHTGETVVSVEGRPLPPTDEGGQGYILIEPSGK
jgi:hypothetical protein